MNKQTATAILNAARELNSGELLAFLNLKHSDLTFSVKKAGGSKEQFIMVIDSIGTRTNGNVLSVDDMIADMLCLPNPNNFNIW